ncbi:MAG: GFA family protein [Proteobacteria bacterium]|nr:GFA family protein [Pseudomonadota bacterium]
MGHQASCCCGQLNLRYDGEIKRVSICHCHQCQRRTGSVFGTQTRLPKEEVAISGGSKTFQRIGDSGGTISFHFCPTCGSTVYYLIDKMPESICVPIGAFADKKMPSPVFSVYEERRHPWVSIPESVAERMD